MQTVLCTLSKACGRKQPLLEIETYKLGPFLKLPFMISVETNCVVFGSPVLLLS